MKHALTPSELRKMQRPELLAELAQKRLQLQKMHLGVAAGSEKDSSKVRMARREVARMLTIVHQQNGALKTSAKVATVPAPVSEKAPAKAKPAKKAKKTVSSKRS